MHETLHPRNDTGRLYVSRKRGGTGLASIEDSVEISIRSQVDYIKRAKKKKTRNSTNDIMINRTTKKPK